MPNSPYDAVVGYTRLSDIGDAFLYEDDLPYVAIARACLLKEARVVCSKNFSTTTTLTIKNGGTTLGTVALTGTGGTVYTGTLTGRIPDNTVLSIQSDGATSTSNVFADVTIIAQTIV